MPEYDWSCPQCGHRFTVRISIDRRHTVRCPECSSQPRQVFTPINFNRGATPAACSTCTQTGCRLAQR